MKYVKSLFYNYIHIVISILINTFWKSLDIPCFLIIVVNMMNKKEPKTNKEFFAYQTLRLQDLITEMVKCCEDRKLYESQKFGLPYSELKVLTLFNGERYLTVKELTDSLIKRRLVERIDDPKDARIKLISLTQAGRKEAEKIDVFHREIHGKILLQMGADERRNLLSNLELLRSAMEAVKAQFV